MNILRKNETAFPTLLNDIFNADWFGGIANDNLHAPAINISESETGFELAVFVPGRNKEDFAIELDNDLLSISSAFKEDAATENLRYTKREFVLGSFKRSFTIPETVATDAIDASYENGILRLKLPKKQEALPKPKRVIELA